MEIESLTLTNFRNWDEVSFEFSNRVLIYGPNALGKTNILESLYILATTRSFRGREAEVIKKGTEFCRVEGVISKDGEEKNVSSLFKVEGINLQKEFKINDKKRPTIDFVGEFSAIVFSPEDLNLISGPPDVKRRYLSFTIGQRDREYLFDLLNYKKILRHRNDLLKKADYGTIRQEIDIWDKSLSESGQNVIAKRNELAHFINERIGKYYHELSGDSLELFFNYIPALTDKTLSESLFSSRDKDIREKTTTTGPHRDTWEIVNEKGEVSRFSSRGEIRTLVLALKLVEKDWFHEKNNDFPVVLLDDVFSELDETRRTYLVDTFRDCQTIMTTTDLDHLSDSLRVGAQIINIEHVGALRGSQEQLITDREAVTR